MTNLPPYPIILVHGVAASDLSKHIKFWGRIPDELRRVGCQVFLGNTDAWGRIDPNARQLAETVDSVLKETGAKKAILIAHSKGGLDSRRLISGFGYAEKVAALASIATPHRGSPLANLILDIEKQGRSLVRQAYSVLTSIYYKDKNPDPRGTATELTIDAMERFNQANPDSPEVIYLSYSSVMQGAMDDLAAFWTYRYLKKQWGSNDGVVPESSAIWGSSYRRLTAPNGGISHAEIVDFKQRNISGANIPSLYLGILEDIHRALGQA